MDHETNYFKKLISEMIYIKTQENSLNSVDDIECLDSASFNLLTKMFNKTQKLIICVIKNIMLIEFSYTLKVRRTTTQYQLNFFALSSGN